MTTPELLMLGTNHFDERGGEKIQASLTQFKPEKILVENSRKSHEINLAARAAALNVLNGKLASDEVRELVLFERDGQLRDIDAVDAYAKSAPGVEVDFFNDDDVQDIETVTKAMHIQLEIVLDQISRLPAVLQKSILQAQLTQMRQGISKARRLWKRDGNTRSEHNFATIARMSDDPRQMIDRDLKMWDVLKKTVGEGGVDKIATVSGAAHVVRTGLNCSVFELAENSGIFTIRRDMIFAR